MAVPIKSGGNLIEVHRAQPVFRPITGASDDYDVTPDGKKFLIKILHGRKHTAYPGGELDSLASG